MQSFDLSGISHITEDSRKVRAGSLFVALKGEKSNGIAFIKQAEQNGAVAVLCDEQAVLPETKLRILRSANPRLALSQIAAHFYPLQPSYLVAITGTDGKTSTADFFRQLCELSGKKSASIGTLGVIGANGELFSGNLHTTPDPLTLHEILHNLAQENYTHVALEASSHGLAQYRLHSASVKAAAFTNIARDHLDYHKTEQEYFAAKKKLFTDFALETAIINADDKKAAELMASCLERNLPIMDFGNNAKELRIISIAPDTGGQAVTAELFGKEYKFYLPLVGAFQVMNVLAALGLAVAGGIKIADLLSKISALKSVPGRLQKVAETANEAGIYVDYAHTPAALENILKTLRSHTAGKLHLIFGCGGNRDSGKRPQMGKIAADLADIVIVTDDNPRNENPAAIRAEIISSCHQAQEIADRKTAIIKAVKNLERGDILVIAGKGHEKTQIIGDQQYPHDDAQVAREAL